ncbi:CBY1 protein, partial [Atractosteus spatula]|nr:CBY1 protein [Atractosteus spatula]
MSDAASVPYSPKIPNPASKLYSEYWLFSPKKVPPRQEASLSSLYVLDYTSRMAELGLDPGPPVLTLGGQTFTFLKGQWVSAASEKSSRVKQVLRKLKRMNRALEEENNYLRVRVELLLDMLTEATAHLQAHGQNWGYKTHKGRKTVSEDPMQTTLVEVSPNK